MAIEAPKFDNRINWNTIPVLITLGSLLISVGYMWSELRGKNDELYRWQVQHDAQTLDRRNESKLRDSNQATINNQSSLKFAGIETDIEKFNNKNTEIDKDFEAVNVRIDRIADLLREVRDNTTTLEYEIQYLKSANMIREGAANIIPKSTNKIGRQNENQSDRNVAPR